jgi:hypothetical protein
MVLWATKTLRELHLYRQRISKKGLLELNRIREIPGRKDQEKGDPLILIMNQQKSWAHSTPTCVDHTQRNLAMV